jgi:hypothetical protein
MRTCSITRFTGQALPALIVSALAGAATLALVYARRFEAARTGDYRIKIDRRVS